MGEAISMDDDTGDARRTVSIGVSKENNEVRIRRELLAEAEATFNAA